MKEFIGLRVKTKKTTMMKIKKSKRAIKFVIKKLQVQDYKSCFEAAQLENKINHLEKK